MFNLTVDVDHSYHVGAAHQLVHNEGCGEASAGAAISDDYARLATQHVTNSGDTVLGHHPAYIDKATSRGASYFDVGSAWDEITASGNDPWVLNRHFLDDRIAAGDRMLLSVPKAKIRENSWTSREIEYLQQNGYRWVNQWSLRAGG